MGRLLPDQSAPPARVAVCAGAGIDPQIAGGDEHTVAKQQRYARALGRRHARLLQQPLQRPPHTARVHPQTLTAPWPLDPKARTERIEIERAMCIGTQLERTAPVRQLEAPRHIEIPSDRRRGLKRSRSGVRRP